MLHIESIKPDASGKYSPLLYKWLIKNKHRRGVFQLKRNRIDGKPTVLGQWRAIDIWIGDSSDEGWLHGNSLASIICKYAKHGFALPIGDGYIDITAEFWATYQRIGRCAWDHSHTMHVIGDENRWHYIAGGRQRECRWCGRVFEAVTTMVPVIEFKESTSWSEYRASAPATLLHPMGSCGESL